MTLNGHKSGCEIDTNLESVASMLESHSQLRGHLTSDQTIISFRFGSDLREAVCAFGAAAGLVGSCRATFFDPEEGEVIDDPKTLITTMQQLLKEVEQS